MGNLRSHLTTIVSAAFHAENLHSEFGRVEGSARPDLGQFQCNGALSAAKKMGLKPRDLAGRVADRLAEDPSLNTVSLAGPGFINLTVTDEALAEHAQQMADDPVFGADVAVSAQRIIVDYGGPNVAKPMHVGHLRAAIIGESVKRIARAVGHDVLGDVHLGDWGLQMGMLISELERRQPNLAYFDESVSGPYPTVSPVSIDDLEEMYPQASAAAKSDPARMDAARRATFDLQDGRPGYRALWQHFHDVSVAELKRDYAQLGVEFDLWLGESDTQQRIPALIERVRRDGFAVESQGALVIDVTEADDKKELPPLILVKSDGAVLYGTTDLATVQQRVEDLSAEAVVYVVDNRQADHFRQVFRAAYKTCVAPSTLRLEHAGFGTMNGKDGKPFKTREGGVMKLKDLMELVTHQAQQRMQEMAVAEGYGDDERSEIARLVGMATLKYADLMNHRTKDYVFDLDRFSSFEGRTGPYILYSVVRARSILRKAVDAGLTPGGIVPPTEDSERELLLKVMEWPDVLTTAFEGRAPNHICEFGYTLATVFNRFYHAHHILKESNPARQRGWLGATALVVNVLVRALDILGIQSPERM